MPEPGSPSHPAMSSSGKAAIAPSCLSSECFDTLTKSCIKCSDLFEDNTTEPTLAPSLTSTFLIFGVPLVVGLILVLAAFCGFLACKVGKQRRKRKAADEEDKARDAHAQEKHQKRKRREKSSAERDLAIMESVGGTTQSPVARPENIDSGSPQPSQDPVMPEGDGALSPAPCLHIVGSLKMPGPPRKARAKQRPCCQGDADGDIVLLSAVYPRPEECNHSFPLPATELGATALVTTKTTQNCAREERV